MNTDAMHGVTVKIRRSSNNKQCLLPKSRGGDKTQGVHSTSKSRGHVPLSTHGSTPMAMFMGGVSVLGLVGCNVDCKYIIHVK